MKRLPLLLAALLLVGNTFAQKNAARTDEVRVILHFAVDDHRLNNAALTELDRFIATLDLNTEYELMVHGHTDSDGQLSYNEVLASERTRTVTERLIAAGVDPARIAARSFGERSPMADSSGLEQKQMNRRVEVVYTQQRLGGMDDLHTRLAGERTTHKTIDPNKENWLRGTNGAVVRMPARALRNANGDVVNGPVDIAITEALGLEAILAEGLSTRSGNNMLETGGMLRIEASTSDGTTLVLDPASPLLVSIPAAMRQEGMSLFTSSDGTDWSNTGQEPLDLRKWDLPRRPFYPWPEFKAPLYKADMSAKPALPVEPARPLMPQSPRKESYSTHVAWHQFLRRDRMAAADQRRYEAAVANYEERMTKYEEKLAVYKEGCRTWPLRYAAYKEAYADWEGDLTCAKEAFHAEVVPAAEEEHRRKMEVSKAMNAKLEAEWRLEYEAKLAVRGRMLDSLGLANANDLGTYVFTASNLGWINCDRFYNVPQSQQFDLVVHDADTTRKNVYLVFTDINSMLRMNRDANGAYVQRAIPRSQAAMVIAYKVENGRAFLCQQKVDPRKPIQLEFKPASVTEVRNAIQGLRRS